MRYISLTAKLLIVSVLFVGCTPLPQKHEVSYSVACTVDTNFHRKYEYRHVPPAVDTKGQAPKKAPAGSMLVGFSNDWESSSAGINYRYLGFAYRGFVFFDRNELPAAGLVLDAKLHFKAPSTIIWQGDNASNSNVSAASKFYILTTPFSGFDSTGDIHVNLPSYTGTVINATFDQNGELVINLTTIIRDIVLGTQSNYGFMLIGFNELYQHNNDQFMSTYEAPTLEVLVLEDVPTWPTP